MILAHYAEVHDPTALRLLLAIFSFLVSFSIATIIAFFRK